MSLLPGRIHPALKEAMKPDRWEPTPDPDGPAASLVRRRQLMFGMLGCVAMILFGFVVGGGGLVVSFFGGAFLLACLVVYGLEVATHAAPSDHPKDHLTLERLADYLVRQSAQPMTTRNIALRDYGQAYLALAKRGDPVDQAAGLAEELASLLDVRLAAVDLESKLRKDRKRIVTSDNLRTEVDDLRARRDASADESARRQWDRALATAESRLRSAEAADRLADRLDAQIEAIRQQTRLLYESFESSVHASSVLPSAEAPTIAAFTSEMRAELDAALAAVSELDRIVQPP